MNDLNTLLGNINRNFLYSPQAIEEVLNHFNSRGWLSRPIRDHSRRHAYMIFGYAVTEECRRIGETNNRLIRRATNRLWRNSTSHEKSVYRDLSRRQSKFRE
ncbi:9131_t:CDS:2 [Diversispora eburnea]|uniref:9131_t:CDS:1 n=1 Tax=Diversispora eburnea TaxID=1213867 RepID=A0A9N8ZPR5_9GLOM|nr:9131_t:CDS:2 [Diversispora eburnea]